MRSAEGSAAEGAAFAPIDFSVLASSYELFRRRERMRELERLVFISILDNKWRGAPRPVGSLPDGVRPRRVRPARPAVGRRGGGLRRASERVCGPKGGV